MPLNALLPYLLLASIQGGDFLITALPSATRYDAALQPFALISTGRVTLAIWVNGSEMQGLCTYLLFVRLFSMELLLFLAIR
jgi:hypothetical protein